MQKGTEKLKTNGFAGSLRRKDEFFVKTVKSAKKSVKNPNVSRSEKSTEITYLYIESKQKYLCNVW